MRRGLEMSPNVKAGLTVIAIGLPIVFAANYLAALAGHPVSLWFMRMIWVVD